MNRHGVQPTLLARQIPACSWHRIPASYRICNICPYALARTPTGSRNTATSKRRHPLWRTVRVYLACLPTWPRSLCFWWTKQCFGGRSSPSRLIPARELRVSWRRPWWGIDFSPTLPVNWCGIEIEILCLRSFLSEVVGTIVDAISIGSLHPHFREIFVSDPLAWYCFYIFDMNIFTKDEFHEWVRVFLKLNAVFGRVRSNLTSSISRSIWKKKPLRI